MNVGIIGIGSFGMKRARAVLSSTRSCLSGIADLDPDLLEGAATRLNTAAFNPSDLIAHPGIDVIMVCTPNRYHFPYARQSLLAGKHVLCEKPLTTTVEDARTLASLAEQTDRIIKIGANHRYFREIRKAKEMVDKGVIGDPVSLFGRIGHDGERTKKTWYWDRGLSGGGTLLDNGWHMIDLARWFLGDLAVAAGAISNVRWKNCPVEDTATAILTGKQGRLAVIASSWAMNSGYLYLELNGTDGFITVDARFPENADAGLLYQDRRLGPEVRRMTLDDERTGSIEAELDSFFGALSEKQKPDPSANDGLKIMRIIDEIYNSHVHRRGPNPEQDPP